MATLPNAYPDAPRGFDADELHGRRVADPYRWLETADAPDTKLWLTEQQDFYEAHRTNWQSRAAFGDRVERLLATGGVGPPVWRGERYFFSRRTPEQEHAVLHTVGPDGVEQTLIDPMTIDPDGTTTLDAWSPSKEGALLAYQLSENGTEESTIRIIDVVTGELVDGPIDRTRVSPVAWLPGGKAFYYVRRLPADQVPEDEAQYHRRIWLHRVGTPDAQDVCVFGDGMDKTTFFGVGTSWDGRWLLVSARQGTSARNDLWIADLTTSDPETPTFVPVLVGADAKTAAHVGRDGRLYIGTDLDATRGRLCVTNPTTPGVEHWRTLIAEDAEAVLESYAILDGAELETPVLLTGWTRHAVSEISVHDLESGERRGTVPLPGLGSIGGLAERQEGGHECWFGYTDFGTPTSVWRYDARSGECDVWETSPGTVDDLPRISTRQVVYESADGTPVRMFVLSAEGADDHPTTARPTILSGYGGFNISRTPAYSALSLAWIEAGGTYAVANLRGGGEEGEAWHRAGRRDLKYKVYEDFEAAADWLVANGETTTDQLVISGGSNGGLLVGAALTRRPEAYRAVICSAPLLDMIRYERFGLGQLWTEEFGTVADPEQFGWLLSYSPYHNVRVGAPYPAVLFTVFDGDSRVDPLHARKMAAELQYASAADPTTAPVLLRCERDVGHAGRSVSRTVGLAADTLAFAAWACGSDDPTS